MENPAIVSELFEHGHSFYGFQIWQQYDRFLDRVLDQGFASEDSKIWRAVASNDLSSWRQFINQGANVNSIVSLQCHGARSYFVSMGARLPYGAKEVSYGVISFDADVSLLMYASVRSTPETVGLLVDAGSDIHFIGVGNQTPLHFMLELSRPYLSNSDPSERVASILIDAGSDVSRTDDSGSTILIEAIDGGFKGAVKRLIEKGADVNHCDNTGKSPLHYATETQNDELVNLLIEHGADLEVRDSRTGYTPLLLAAIGGYKQCLKRLIDAGADINATLPSGEGGVLDYVTHDVVRDYDSDTTTHSFQNMEDIEEMLFEAGARYQLDWNQSDNESLRKRISRKRNFMMRWM